MESVLDIRCNSPYVLLHLGQEDYTHIIFKFMFICCWHTHFGLLTDKKCRFVFTYYMYCTWPALYLIDNEQIRYGNVIVVNIEIKQSDLYNFGFGHICTLFPLTPGRANMISGSLVCVCYRWCCCWFTINFMIFTVGTKYAYWIINVTWMVLLKMNNLL